MTHRNAKKGELFQHLKLRKEGRPSFESKVLTLRKQTHCVCACCTPFSWRTVCFKLELSLDVIYLKNNKYFFGIFFI